jgi:putative tricarboxylic transport membrane protein
MLDVAGAAITGLTQVLTWSAGSRMLIGIAIGFVVGILPGLGGPTTLALMLPFIFKMSAVEAFAFLLGMAAVTATTGDITSVLFGVPGEPTTASTIVDGHPMARKGEAGRALGAALMSSLVGAIFGALALAAAIPVVRPLVLSFGSPEFFMLALLGTTFVAALSGRSRLKGLIAAGVGFLLATIGLDQFTGIQRYTFGQLALWDGVGLVPVTLGLFAIPEVIDLAVQGTAIAQQDVGRLGGVMEGVKDTFRHFWLVIRCSAIGTYVGVIPGMGGSVSQWLAYAHAVQSSPDRARFGRGAVEGVLGPGAANNSTLGGALIPTVAFGVPGSLTTAILLGAFLIQGIQPGPHMLAPEPAGHLALTFSFVWVIVLSNLLTVGICFLLLRPLVSVTRVRVGILTPFILLLIYLGAFAEKNDFDDLVITLLFGALGWVMVKLDWPRPPLLLGLVLGPLMENRLFLSTGNYGVTWLWRPGVLILIAVGAAALFYPTLARRRRPESSPATAEVPVGPSATAAGSGWDILFALAIAAATAAALWLSRGFGYRAGLFPWVIGSSMLLLTLGQLGVALAARRATGVERPAPADAETRRRTLEIAGWIAGFFVAIWLLGFMPAVPVATLLYLRLSARERWPLAATLTALGWASFYLLFDRALHLPFPEGWLLGRLG